MTIEHCEDTNYNYCRMDISSPYEGKVVLAGNIFKGNFGAPVGYDSLKDYYTAEAGFILIRLCIGSDGKQQLHIGRDQRIHG